MEDCCWLERSLAAFKDRLAKTLAPLAAGGGGPCIW